MKDFSQIQSFASQLFVIKFFQITEQKSQDQDSFDSFDETTQQPQEQKQEQDSDGFDEDTTQNQEQEIKQQEQQNTEKEKEDIIQLLQNSQNQAQEKQPENDQSQQEVKQQVQQITNTNKQQSQRQKQRSTKQKLRPNKSVHYRTYSEMKQAQQNPIAINVSTAKEAILANQSIQQKVDRKSLSPSEKIILSQINGVRLPQDIYSSTSADEIKNLILNELRTQVEVQRNLQGIQADHERIQKLYQEQYEQNTTDENNYKNDIETLKEKHKQVKQEYLQMCDKQRNYIQQIDLMSSKSDKQLKKNIVQELKQQSQKLERTQPLQAQWMQQSNADDLYQIYCTTMQKASVEDVNQMIQQNQQLQKEKLQQFEETEQETKQIITNQRQITNLLFQMIGMKQQINNDIIKLQHIKTGLRIQSSRQQFSKSTKQTHQSQRRASKSAMQVSQKGQREQIKISQQKEQQQYNLPNIIEDNQNQEQNEKDAAIQALKDTASQNQ